MGYCTTVNFTSELKRVGVIDTWSSVTPWQVMIGRRDSNSN